MFSSRKRSNQQMLVAISSQKELSAKCKRYSRIIFMLILCSILIFLVYYLISTFSLQISSLETRSIQTSPSYVITLSGHDQRVPTVVDLFKKFANLHLRPYYGINGNILYKAEEQQRLTPGERGLRETMKKFFTMILRKNYNEVFVFEDDAIPHLNFTTLFNQLPNRCCEADVLLLGANLWHKS